MKGSAVMTAPTLKVVECPRCSAPDTVVGASLVFCQTCNHQYVPEHGRSCEEERPEGTCLACPNVRMDWWEGAQYGLREAVCGVTGARVYRAGDRKVRELCKFAEFARRPL